MRGIVVRDRDDRRKFVTSLAVSALVHGAVIAAAVLIAPHVRPHNLATPDLAEATQDPEMVSLVWPLQTRVREPEREPQRIAQVERAVPTNQRDHDDGVGEPAVGDIPGATESGAPANTDAPLSPDIPAAQGLGNLAEAPLPERSPAPAPGLLPADSTIAVPDLPVVEGVPAANGTAQTNADEKKEDGDGGGLGSIIEGIGGFLGGIKVSVGGTGGGGMGGGGMGGGGKGGCVPGIGGIIGERGGKGGGAVAIPQGPGIRTGIGGRGRFPFASGGGPLNLPHRTSAC